MVGSKLHVLVAVDMVRHPSERDGEGIELGLDLGADDGRLETAGKGQRHQRRQIGKRARAGGRREIDGSGWNGPVSVRCRPMPNGRGVAVSRSRAASVRKPGTTVITEVADSRPAAARSRIAAETPGARA